MKSLHYYFLGELRVRPDLMNPMVSFGASGMGGYSLLGGDPFRGLPMLPNVPGFMIPPPHDLTEAVGEKMNGSHQEILKRQAPPLDLLNVQEMKKPRTSLPNLRILKEEPVPEGYIRYR